MLKMGLDVQNGALGAENGRYKMVYKVVVFFSLDFAEGLVTETGIWIR